MIDREFTFRKEIATRFEPNLGPMNHIASEQQQIPGIELGNSGDALQVHRHRIRGVVFVIQNRRAIAIGLEFSRSSADYFFNVIRCLPFSTCRTE